MYLITDLTFTLITNRTLAYMPLIAIELIAGQLPRRQQRLIEAWMELHHEELLADWERLQSGQAPFKIDPLQ